MINLRYGILKLGTAVGSGTLTPYSPYQEYFPYMDLIPNPYVKVDSLGVASHPFDSGPEQIHWDNAKLNWMFYVKLMVGITTPNGYEVGIPYHHPFARLGTDPYTISGGDSALYACDATTGMITVADAASITTGGTPASPVTHTFDFNTPDGSTFSQTVLVFDGTLSTGRGSAASGDFLFYDGDDGDDSNDGTEPHKPKKTLPYSWSTDFTEYAYCRQGSTFPDQELNIWTTFVPSKYFAYGSPMTDTDGALTLTPQWEFIVPSGFSGTTNTDSCLYRKNSNMAGVKIHGAHANANADVKRGMSFSNSDNVELIGCKVSNNINNANSNGFNFANSANCLVAWCQIADDVNGDGIYTKGSDSFARVFCTAGYPGGSAADNWQNSQEVTSSNFSENYVSIGNIGFQEYNASGSQKGSEAFSGVFRSIHWLNIYYANRFNLGKNCFTGLVMNEYSINKAGPTFLSTYAMGAEQTSGNVHWIANFGGGGGVFFKSSGFSDTHYQGGEFWRSDIKFKYNMGWLNTYGLSSDRKFSGDVSDNWFFGNTVRTEDLKDKTYSLTGDIVSIELFSSTYMRITTANPHFISKDDTVTISGSDHAGNNGTFTVYTDATYIAANQFTAYNASAGNSSNSGMTYTGVAGDPLILEDDIVEMSVSGQEVTVLSKQNHQLRPNQYVVQSGCTNAVNDGVKKIDSIFQDFDVQRTITTVAVSGTTITITLSSAHSLKVGQSVYQTNCSSSNNGHHIVTATPTSTTYQYEDASATAESGISGKTLYGLHTYTYTEANGTPIAESAPASGHYVAVQEATLQTRGSQWSAPLIKSYKQPSSVPTLSGTCGEGEIITLTIPTLASGFSVNRIIYLSDDLEIPQMADSQTPTIPAGVAGENKRRPVMTQTQALFTDLEKRHLGCIVEVIEDATGYRTPWYAQWDDGLMWRPIIPIETPADYVSSGVNLWADPEHYIGDDDSDVVMLENQIDNTNNMVNLSGANTYKFKRSHSVNGLPAIVAEDTTARFLQLERKIVSKYLYVVFIYKDGVTGTFDASNRRLIGGDESFDRRRVISNGSSNTFIPGGIYSFDTSGTSEMNGAVSNVALPTGVNGKIFRFKAQNTGSCTILAVAGTTVTVTVASTSELRVGMRVLQEGFANAENNKEIVITAIPGGTTYQYEDATAISEASPGSATYSAGYENKFALGSPSLSASGVIDGAYLGFVGVDRELAAGVDDAILNYYSKKYGITVS